MINDLHSLKPADKDVVMRSLRDTLAKHREIVFVYLHGSFVSGNRFRDIDMAVYVKNPPPSVLEYELQLERELMSVLGRYIIDVRVLNAAPLSFRYNIIKGGVVLLTTDDDARADFQEATLSAYFDFLPYHNRYLQETLGVEL